MIGGTWQHTSRHDWQRLQQHLLGTSTTNGHSGRNTLAIVGATLVAVLVLLVLLAILAITHRWPFRRPPAAAPSS